MPSTSKVGMLTVATIACSLFATPAWALEFVRVPEPSSLTLVAAGVAATVIVARLRRRR